MQKLTAFAVLGILSIAPATAFADPPIDSPPPVFCFAKTAADAINGGNGIRIQFEILNWTNTIAHGVKLTANTDPAFSTGINGAGDMFDATVPAPLFGPFPGKARTNDWTVTSASTTMVTWSAGTELSNGDPNNAPNPIDSGVNTLDGFILDLPFLSVHERVVFDWELLDFNGDTIRDGTQFGFGTFQIDRATDAPDGRIRQTQFAFPGVPSGSLPAPPPLDPTDTDNNAITDPSIVPLPAPIAMLLAGLLALVGIRRRATV